jgi:hypothetical protein
MIVLLTASGCNAFGLRLVFLNELTANGATARKLMCQLAQVRSQWAGCCQNLRVAWAVVFEVVVAEALEGQRAQSTCCETHLLSRASSCVVEVN